MDNITYILKKISMLTKVGIYLAEEETLQSFEKNTEWNPILKSKELLLPVQHIH